jgi:glycosyltransferase involved in cell wall biosynthesis
MLKKSNIYIAPRKIEGIGISFLEAMSLGLVVIAYNYGTMNEYIKHNYNGYLFNSETIQINFDNLEEVRNNSKNMVREGWEKWEKDKNIINDFILTDNYKFTPINHLYFFIYSAFQQSEIYLRRTAKRNITKMKGILRIKSS